MLVLVSETIDKSTRNYIDVEPDFLLKIIENDYGLHEVIPMHDFNIYVRLFFDIDIELFKPGEYINLNDLIYTIMDILNNYYNTSYDDWTFTSATNEKKISYHIYSNKYCTKLNKLKNDVDKMNNPYFDKEVYNFSINFCKDEGSFRLPNQSKKSINKEGGIHKIIKGELKNCLVTQINGLIKI